MQIIDGKRYRVNDTTIIRHTSFGEFVSRVRRVELLDDDSTSGTVDESLTPTESIPEITTSTTEVSVKADSPSAKPSDGEDHDEEESIDRGSPEVYAPENENEIDNGFQVPDRRSMKIVQRV